MVQQKTYKGRTSIVKYLSVYSYSCPNECFTLVLLSYTVTCLNQSRLSESVHLTFGIRNNLVLILPFTLFMVDFIRESSLR